MPRFYHEFFIGRNPEPLRHGATPRPLGVIILSEANG